MQTAIRQDEAHDEAVTREENGTAPGGRGDIISGIKYSIPRTEEHPFFARRAVVMAAVARREKEKKT